MRTIHRSAALRILASVAGIRWAAEMMITGFSAQEPLWTYQRATQVDLVEIRWDPEALGLYERGWRDHARAAPSTPPIDERAVPGPMRRPRAQRLQQRRQQQSQLQLRPAQPRKPAGSQRPLGQCVPRSLSQPQLQAKSQSQLQSTSSTAPSLPVGRQQPVVAPAAPEVTGTPAECQSSAGAPTAEFSTTPSRPVRLYLLPTHELFIGVRPPAETQLMNVNSCGEAD